MNKKMANTYTYSRPDKTMTRRSSDGAFVPWDPVANTPADTGYAYRVWIDDGSPAPLPYVPPS